MNNIKLNADDGPPRRRRQVGIRGDFRSIASLLRSTDSDHDTAGDDDDDGHVVATKKEANYWQRPANSQQQQQSRTSAIFPVHPFFFIPSNSSERRTSLPMNSNPDEERWWLRGGCLLKWPNMFPFKNEMTSTAPMDRHGSITAAGDDKTHTSSTTMISSATRGGSMSWTAGSAAISKGPTAEAGPTGITRASCLASSSPGSLTYNCRFRSQQPQPPGTTATPMQQQLPPFMTTSIPNIHNNNNNNKQPEQQHHHRLGHPYASRVPAKRKKARTSFNKVF